MISDPGAVGRAGSGMQGIFGEAVFFAQRGEGDMPFLLLAAWDGPGLLPARVRSHALHAAFRLAKQGIVELARCFQMGPQVFGLPLVHHQRQFQQKRGRLLFGFLWFLGFFGPPYFHQPPACFAVFERLF